MTDDEMNELARTVFGQAEQLQRDLAVVATGLETLLLAMAERKRGNGRALQSIRPTPPE